ncbi:FkbM family methyltransferase [Bosea sp. 2YAB26]|uniref:FkbM family methyltransferase n=1 Tax=Bosea sp. 2YAB26 TaxID=3237478 RepID=UPI003F9311B4
MTNAAMGAAGRLSARLSAKLQQSADVLQDEGALRFLELSALSLSAPVRSMRVRIAVSADAKRAIAKIKSSSCGRGLFIDCGSNVGQGYSVFSRYYTEEYFDFIMIEPNKSCLPYLQALQASSSANIEIIGKAASVREGFTKLFGPPSDRRQPTYEGRSIVPEHNSSLYAAGDADSDVVETFSLSNLIMAKKMLYDVVVLKLDVEGAEYEILFDMINTGAHRELYAAYIEFHSIYMKRLEREIKVVAESNIRKTIESDGILFREWI